MPSLSRKTFLFRFLSPQRKLSPQIWPGRMLLTPLPRFPRYRRRTAHPPADRLPHLKKYRHSPTQPATGLHSKDCRNKKRQYPLRRFHWETTAPAPNRHRSYHLFPVQQEAPPPSPVRFFHLYFLPSSWRYSGPAVPPTFCPSRRHPHTENGSSYTGQYRFSAEGARLRPSIQRNSSCRYPGRIFWL